MQTAPEVTPQEVSYHLSEREFLAGCAALWAYRAVGRAGNFAAAAIVASGGALLLGAGVPGLWGPALIFCGALFIALDLWRTHLWRGHYRRSRGLRGQIILRLTAEGVRVWDQAGERVLRWQQFQAFAQTEVFLFLILSPRQFLIVPVGAFADQASLASFADVLSRRVRRLPRRIL